MTARSSQCVRPSRHRGMAMVYSVLVIGVMLMFASLAVDLARVQVAKSQLRTAADAAARIGAFAYPYGSSMVYLAAQTAASDNKVDNSQQSLLTSDIEVGTWNPTTKVFATTAFASANAIRITAYRSASRSTAIPLSFAAVMGVRSCDIKAQAIGYYVSPVNVSLPVPATSCPWLAGASSGTVANAGNPHNNPDYAPQACPQLMSGVPLVSGQALQFNSINGGANNFSSDVNYTPDGNTDWITDNFAGSENGLSDLTAPINCVVGVFLDNSNPNLSNAPAALDFSTDASRDFASLSPLLKQPFFIGDGLRADGTTKQNFIVPNGATRLYIGTMDGYEWNNNQGSYTTTIVRPSQVQLVK